MALESAHKKQALWPTRDSYGGEAKGFSRKVVGHFSGVVPWPCDPWLFCALGKGRLSPGYKQ